MIGPIITPMPQTDIAIPRCSWGKMSSRVACDSGTRAALNMPCSRRNSTICASDCAAPQSIDVRVNPMMQAT